MPLLRRLALIIIFTAGLVNAQFGSVGEETDVYESSDTTCQKPPVSFSRIPTSYSLASCQTAIVSVASCSMRSGYTAPTMTKCLLNFDATAPSQSGSTYLVATTYSNTATCCGSRATVVSGYIADGSCRPSGSAYVKQSCVGSNATVWSCVDSACQNCQTYKRTANVCTNITVGDTLSSIKYTCAVGTASGSQTGTGFSVSLSTMVSFVAVLCAFWLFQ